jgi:hypothetical protein
MVARPNNPIEKVRELQRRLYIAAKRTEERRFHALYDEFWQSDVLPEAWKRLADLERACRMRRPSVSRMREIRTSGLKGDLRKRSPSATAPEVYR